MYMESEIRIHAFDVIHDYENYEDFEAEMIRFGLEDIPPYPSPTAKDPHMLGSCRSCARWAWERKDTIVPYHDFCAGKRSEKFQASSRVDHAAVRLNEDIRAYHDDERHTWSQTAAHFNLSEGAARQRAYRARKERAA